MKNNKTQKIKLEKKIVSSHETGDFAMRSERKEPKFELLSIEGLNLLCL